MIWENIYFLVSLSSFSSLTCVFSFFFFVSGCQTNFNNISITASLFPYRLKLLVKIFFSPLVFLVSSYGKFELKYPSKQFFSAEKLSVQFFAYCLFQLLHYRSTCRLLQRHRILPCFVNLFCQLNLLGTSTISIATQLSSNAFNCLICLDV